MYLKPELFENLKCISKLRVGDKFVKVYHPCVSSNIYRLDGELGGMYKATLLDDNSPVVIKKRLVLPL